MASVVDDDDHPLVPPDSDEDIDWEEVEVEPEQHQNIEVTLQTRPDNNNNNNKRKGVSHAERLLRIDCHKIHTVTLLANARLRNKWINDELLHARLLSLTPLSLQNAFAMIHKSRIPDRHQRGRSFQSAIEDLTEWWSSSFFSVEPVGHIRNRTYDDVRRMLTKSKSLAEDALEWDEEELGGEVIRSEKSLMKHALMQCGSRDTAAQLFTALCRALDIPARLVVSLQSVPWQAGVGKPKPKYNGKKGDVKGKGKARATDDEEEEDMEEVHIPKRNHSFVGEGDRLDGKPPGQYKVKPIIRLRKQKPKGNRLGSTPPRREKTPDPTVTPPVFWTEVFSRADGRWLPVDPIRCIVNKRKVFDPPSSSSATRQENRMVYVVAFEEDGYARDVTPRYAREFGAKVAKVQGGSGSGGNARKEWWSRVVRMVTRPYRLHRDDVEDEELESNQMTEGMPTTMTGFKDHPLYVLARHLKQNETIHPLVELGKFRGEPVYSRSAVLSLKAAENWMRQGRKIREGCQPLKWVKQRASTINRKREIEMAMEREREERGGAGVGEESEMLQGLYAENQTELYTPKPIVDGKIPKNDFGNIDLYVPSMLPQGAVHIPFKGTARIARKLGFDFAEAVTGFEFKKRRAFPIVEGVVVAADNESILLEAYWEAEQEAAEKARSKREDRVIKIWTRLIHGLRIRQRLQAQYANKPEEERHWLDTQSHALLESGKDKDKGAVQAGEYLTAADDVVQAFHLPKYQHAIPEFSDTPSPSRTDCNGISIGNKKVPGEATALMESEPEQDVEMAVKDTVSPSAQPSGGSPLTMRQLASVANQQPLLGTASSSAKSLYPQAEGCGNTPSGTRTTPVDVSNGDDARKVKSTIKSLTSTRKHAREENGTPPQEVTPKRRKEVGAPPTPIPARVLRPRASKTATQNAGEKV